MTPPPTSTRARWALLCKVGAAALAATALLLPVHPIVEALARSVHTVRNFPQDFVNGFQMFRVACAVNAILLALLPRLLARAEFAPLPPSDWSPRDRLPAAALYGVAFLLALPGIRESIQIDEWNSILMYIRHGPAIIVTRSAADNHVLYSLLAWPFFKMLGGTEVALRLPSLLLGPLSPTLLYALLRRGQPRLRAFVASLPLAVSPFLLLYSHEGRAYAALFSALLGLCLLQPAALAGSFRAWIGFVALATAAVYLHIFGSLAVAALAASAFFRAEGRTPSGRARNVAGFLLCAGISLLLYSPILMQYFSYSSDVRILGLPRSEERFPIAVGFVLSVSPWWALSFVAAFAAGALVSRRPTPETIAALLTAALQFVIVEWSFSDQAARYYTPTLALAWPVIGAGLVCAGRKGMAGAAGLLVLSLAADARYLHLGRFDYREAARRIERDRRPEESFAVLFDSRPLNAYLRSPVEVRRPEEFCANPPTWFTLIDVNRDILPQVADLADRDYSEEFRLPALRGNLVGYRRKDRRAPSK